MFKVKLTERGKKELKQISRQHQITLGYIFEELKENPFLGKPLARELTGKFSYKVSVFRIIYKISEKDKIVYVLTAGHRGKVYK